MTTTSFLSLSGSLAKATTAAEKKKLSRQLSAFLQEDLDFSSLVLHSLVMNVLREIPELATTLEGEFFKVRHQVYRDEDAVFRVAMGIAYLQTHGEAKQELDLKVIESLVAEVARMNLDLVVNDITVNLTQVRNGEVGSLL